jgi:hypothetical protein
VIASALAICSLACLASYATVTPTRECLIMWLAFGIATVIVITWYLASIP